MKPQVELFEAAPGILVPGAVFDCNIYLQAAIRDTGPAFACLEAAESGAVALFANVGTMTEIESVLSRPKARRKFPVLTPVYVNAFLARVAATSVLVTDVPAVVSLLRDPKDEPYLNLAVAAGARYLVSWDKDLLDLMDAGSEDARAVRRTCPDLEVLDPVRFLRRVVATE